MGRRITICSCAFRKKRTGSDTSRECFIIGGARSNQPRTTSGANRARWKRDGARSRSIWYGGGEMLAGRSIGKHTSIAFGGGFVFGKIFLFLMGVPLAVPNGFAR